jgi:hypothetical protein
VEYRYQLSVRGYAVSRCTEISDGCVTLTTSTGWVETVKIGRLTREIPINVTVVIEATEGVGRTRLHGYARGHADLAEFRCRLIRRFADKQAAAELDSGLATALLRIQTGGTELYEHGASDVLTIVRESIRIGSRR